MFHYDALYERHESNYTIHAFQNIEKSIVHYLFAVFTLRHAWSIKAWVKCVKVFRIKLILDGTEGFAKT